MHRILVLEDHPGWEALVVSAMRNGEMPPCVIDRAQTYEEAMSLIEGNSYNLAMLDYSLGDPGPAGPKNGLDVAQELRRRCPGVGILLVTLVDPARLADRCDALNVRLVEKGRPDLEQEILREAQDALAQGQAGA
jgi:DNA-binding NarL/FixJ family response regulator